MEFNSGDPDEVFALICENFQSAKSIRPFARLLVDGIFEHKNLLDELIRKSSRHWRIERMSKTDISILRLGAYEIRFIEDIPPKVTIDEAVELAKKYGSEESGAFINGILDDIYNRLKLSDNDNDRIKAVTRT